jgi:hypothetical protein
MTKGGIMSKGVIFCFLTLFALLLILSCTREPVIPDTNAPVINSIEACPHIVSKGGTVYLNLAVTDPDEDKMYFLWSCSVGQFFSDEDLTTPSNITNPIWWSAPSSEGTYQITVTCTDSIGETPVFVDTNVTVSVSIYSLDSIIGEEKFSSPFAMYLDDNGNLFVSDPGLNAVHFHNGSNWYSWNFAGLDSDSVFEYDTVGFDTTIDSTVTPWDTVLSAIVDTLFDSLNIFLAGFTNPTALTVDETNDLLYVVDKISGEPNDTSEVSVYDVNSITSPSDTLYGFLHRVNDREDLAYPMKAPYDLVVNPVNRWLYISAGGFVVAYDSSWFFDGWNKLWTSSMPVVYKGHGVDITSDTLYLACFASDTFSAIWRYVDIMNPTVPTIDLEVSDSTLQYVNGIAVAPSGNIFVTEGGGSEGSYHRVCEYDRNGNFVRTFGSIGEEPDQFNFPSDIFIDDAGKIYIVDMGNHCIKVFSE